VLLQNKLLPAKLAVCPPARIWLPLTDSGATSARAGAAAVTATVTSERNLAIPRMFLLSNFMFMLPTPWFKRLPVRR
jgi:hypothetical protein